MTERRVLIAAAISIAFMAAYSQWLTTRYPAAARRAPVAAAPAGAAPSLAAEDAFQGEPVVRVDGDGAILEIGARSAGIRRVTLKDFKDHNKKGPAQFGGTTTVFRANLPVPTAEWTVVRESPGQAEFKSSVNGKDYHLSYKCCDPKYVVNIELVTNTLVSDLVITTGWTRADDLSERQNMLEAVAITKDNPQAAVKYHRTTPAPKASKNVPRGTQELTLSERYFCQSVRFSSLAQATILPTSPGTIAASSVVPVTDGRLTANLYLGPRDFFYLRAAGFAEAFKLGILDQIGLMLLLALSWLAKLTKSYGIAIILFASGITSLMSPFTLLGYRSMKKMQELKPQMDAVMAKHKDDPQRANKEMFALYKEHRISPLSGCLPMLFQLPVFLALFKAISHFIELRGQEFLWIKDLSMPDRLFHLPLSVPILGNEINALPIIMAGAMFLQSRLTQTSMPSADANPTAKLMSGPMMSVIFGLMFYHFPSGLVLYWLFNSLTSMVWYRLAK